MARTEQSQGDDRSADVRALTREDVDELAKIVDGLKNGAQSAADDGNKVVARMYQLLVKMASPIVIKGYARLEREELAALNKLINPPKYKIVRQPINGSDQS